MRVGASYFPRVGHVAAIAAEAEAAGLDDISLGDSPLLAGELYASLMTAAYATSRLELVAGVTNSVTRDPVVTASGIATVAHASGGRVVCGIGRGDSAVLKIGKRPDSLERFERAVALLRQYLDGTEVTRGDVTARIEWIGDVPRVPIEIVATGPKVLAIAARHADRIGLGVGADPEWVAHNVALARRAIEEAGRDPATVEIGAYVPCVLASERAVAVREARYIAAKFANFNALGGASNTIRRPSVLAETVELMRSTYSYHGDPGMAAAEALTDEFVEWISLLGPGHEAARRVRELRETGLAYVRLMSGFHRLPAEVARDHHRLLAEVVIAAAAEPGSPASRTLKTDLTARKGTL